MLSQNVISVEYTLIPPLVFLFSNLFSSYDLMLRSLWRGYVVMLAIAPLAFVVCAKRHFDVRLNLFIWLLVVLLECAGADFLQHK